MIRVSVETVGSTKDILDKLNSMRNVNFEDVGEVIRKRLIWQINASRRRAIKKYNERYLGRYAKHLADTIKVEVGQNSIGIGNIDEMDKLTPYWKVVNNGGYVPPTTRGFFTGAGKNASFKYSARGPRLKPKKPINAMNYIDDTVQWVNKNLIKFMDDAIAKGAKDRRSSYIVKVR